MMNSRTNRLNWAAGKVINLHYTDICNYRCRFCHSRFGTTPLRFEDWERIIANIVESAPVKRFNLAGGEPMAAPYVQKMIDSIHALGIDCSIITNGSLLTPDFIRRNAGRLSMIGISMDAFCKEDNIRLGRVDGAGRTLAPERLVDLADCIHSAGMRLKINTVVNAVNVNRDFSPVIRKIQPDRWKLLRVLHFDHINDSADDLMISDRQFQDFVARHTDLNPVVENTEDIVSAYIVINPVGRLIDNSSGTMRAGESLLDHSFADEFRKIAFNEAAYAKRY